MGLRATRPRRSKTNFLRLRVYACALAFCWSSVLLAAVLVANPAGAEAAGAEAPESPLHARCDTLCARVVSCLESTMRNLQGMSKAFSVERLDRRAAEPLLQSQIALYQDGNGLAWIGEDGVIVAVSPGVPGDWVGQSVVDSEGWRRMQEQRDVVLCAASEGGPGPSSGRFLVPLAGPGERLAGALQFSFSLAGLFGAVCREMEREGAHYEVWLPSGAVVFESADLTAGGAGVSRLAAGGRPSVLELRGRILKEPRGAGGYTLLNPVSGRLTRAEVAWVRGGFHGLDWIVLGEADSEFQEGDSDGLTGYWMGAYSEKPRAVAGGAEEAWPLSGQLNLTILQDGSHVQLWTRGREWIGLSSGVYIDGRIVATHVKADGAPRPAVWFWTAAYDGTNDALKGTIWGDAREVVIERSFFVRRSPAGL